jgi:hypothetical protein
MPEQVPFTNPTRTEEVVANIAATIGEDVFNEMASLGWNNHDPRPPAQPDNPVAGVSTPELTQPTLSGQPAPAPAKAAPTADAPSLIDWGSLKDPQTGLILQKYTSETEAIKGVGHAVRMAKDALGRNAELEAQLHALQEQLRTTPPAPIPGAAPVLDTPGPSPRTSPVVRSPKLDTVLASLRENPVLDEEGISALMDAVADQSKLAAESAVEHTVTSRASAAREQERVWNEVDQYMATTYPDSIRFVDEMGVFAESTPLVKEVVGTLIAKGKHKEAAEFAWKEFASAHSADLQRTVQTTAELREIRGDAADQVRREATDEARRQAGIVATSAGGVHEVEPQGATPEELQDAVNAMRSGYPERWRALTIGKTLTGPFFDGP